MAVKKFRSYNEVFRKLNKKICLGLFIFFTVLTVLCAGYRVNNKVRLAEYEVKIAEMETKIKKISDENAEFTEILNSTDRSAYYEKKARENYGYGKPGEYIFYLMP